MITIAIMKMVMEMTIMMILMIMVMAILRSFPSINSFVQVFLDGHVNDGDEHQEDYL